MSQTGITHCTNTQTHSVFLETAEALWCGAV